MHDTAPTLLSDPLVGTRLGEYEVQAPVGEGAMGVVYRGIQPVIKKRVAIKVLKPHIANDESHVRRLVAEAEAVNSIGHRNIIDIFGLGRLPDGRPYIIMEYLEGVGLDSLLRGAQLIPLPDALGLLADICAPLAAAHRANVVHRDLKPSNVFVCRQEDGQRFVKLLDFGLAKRAVELSDAEKTAAGTIAGTPNYMSPEQARSLPVSARSDLYALGVIAFEMVTGELPFAGPTPMDTLMLHLSAPVPSARAKNPAVPRALDALIAKLLAKREEDRPANAEDVRQRLLAIRAAPPEPPDGAPRSKRAVALAVGGGALALVAAVALLRPAAPPPVAPEAATLPPAQFAPLPPVEAPPAPAAPTPATPAPASPEPAPAEPVAAKVPPDATKPKPSTSPRAPALPDAAALRRRVATLDAALKKHTADGEEADPSAVALLAKYRVEATMVSTPAERSDLAKRLDDFERAFLQK